LPIHSLGCGGNVCGEDAAGGAVVVVGGVVVGAERGGFERFKLTL
jgi:hypothetical protein